MPGGAALDVAVRIAVEPWTVTDEHLASLRQHGLTDEDVWDVGAISAFFAMSNRLVHLILMMPNEEFYLMGGCRDTRTASRQAREATALPRSQRGERATRRGAGGG